MKLNKTIIISSFILAFSIITSGQIQISPRSPSNGTVTGGTCTNQAVTAISTLGVPICTTITSAYTTGLATTAATLAQFASTTSAQLFGIISDETGTGVLVGNTSPTLVSPVLGAATATTVTSGYYIGNGSGLAVANVGANSCGTTAATVAGGASSFEVTVGATSGTQCRVTLPTAPTRWNCISTDTSTAVLTRISPVDTTHVDILGVFTAADVISVTCVARQVKKNG